MSVMNWASSWAASSSWASNVAAGGVQRSRFAAAYFCCSVPASSSSVSLRRSSTAAACCESPAKPALVKKAASWKWSLTASVSFGWWLHQARSLRLSTLQKPSMALVCVPSAATNSLEWLTIEWSMPALLRSRYIAAASVAWF